MKFKLKDASPNADKVVKGKIVQTSGGIEIFAEGYGSCNMENGYGAPIFLEIWEGKLRLHVFADINREDSTHTIDLEGALESARNETCEECGNSIPETGGSLANKHHKDSCSLYDQKEN